MRRVGSLSLLLAVAWSAFPASAQIVGTAHNLSATGPGGVRAAEETEICIFCHTPHNSLPSTPLWNRSVPPPVYQPYSSSTMNVSPGQPTGSSKLCLSCHDGTIGLGSVLSRAQPIPMTSELTSETNLTTDLSDDHPISFAYSAGVSDPELVPEELLPAAVKLDATGQLQCTSCHDPHSSPYPKFLVESTEYSALCLACHDKEGWIGSSHESSTATWDGTGRDPWPHTEHATVAANGCENCHDPHNAGRGEQILNERQEEENCLVCHDGRVAGANVAADLQKLSRHPVETFVDVHDPVEDFELMDWHVECEDCHNPHAVRGTDAQAPAASGPLESVAGVTLSGSRIERVEFQYEVCFRCHGDNVNAPPPAFERVVSEPNLRLKFDLGSVSYHPVAAPVLSPGSPSLILSDSGSSVIYCTDCHASNNGPGAGGSGAAGPHGSIYPFLLEREYRTASTTPESEQAYALCYKCHSRSSILSDTSFEEHSKHLGENVPCSACHDPHGVPPGGSGDHTHLINFRTDLVEPVNGRLEFIDEGIGRGSCYLVCHGETHDPESYGDGGGSWGR